MHVHFCKFMIVFFSYRSQMTRKQSWWSFVITSQKKKALAVKCKVGPSKGGIAFVLYVGFKFFVLLIETIREIESCDFPLSFFFLHIIVTYRNGTRDLENGKTVFTLLCLTD